MGGTCTNSTDLGQLVTCQEGQTSCFKSESSEWLAGLRDPQNKTEYLGSVCLMMKNALKMPDIVFYIVTSWLGKNKSLDLSGQYDFI